VTAYCDKAVTSTVTKCVSRKVYTIRLVKNQPENCKRLYKNRDTELNITKVFDSGDAGGIVCTVLEENKEVLIVSLTHLQIKPAHPLSEKIVAYQKQRVKINGGNF
jgi:nitrogen regulatory protein PII-like uncharacterized protein